MKNIYIIFAILLLISCAPSSEVSVPINTPDSLATSTPTPYLSIAVSPSLALSPTPNATEFATDFVQNNCATMGLDAKTSTDGSWLASPCLDENDSHIRIAKFDETKAWDLSFKEITGASPCLGYTNEFGEAACFSGVLYIDHWFKNGRYVFIEVNYLIDRSIPFSFGLYRIDTETGQISPYLPMSDSTYDYAFAPDDENYAYVTESDNYLLHIVSIESGQNSTFIVPGSYSSTGELSWSPDNNSLVLVARGIGWEENPAVGFSLVLLDVKSAKFTTLIPSDIRRLRPEKWLTDDVLLLNGFSEDGQAYLEYQLTISDNQLLEVPSATPTP